MANNYTLGRGELWFAPFLPGTQTPRGERYIGNSPEFNITVETENLDHYNSDRGVREKDESIALQTDRNGTFTTDNIDPNNLALFFFGSTTALTVAGGTISGEPIGPVELGLTYQLGTTENNPAGARNVSAVTVHASGSAPVAASGTVSFSAAGSASDTVTIGSTVYTLVAAPADPFDVDIGADAAETASNLAAAINAGAGSGVAYGAGTTAHPDVTATANAGVVTVTANVAGTSGNAIALAKNGDDIAVSGATLSGGTGGYAVGTDYTVDLALGRITILADGAITDGATIEVDYTVASGTRERVVSGSQAIEGQLRYISYNPAGKQFDYLLPWVKITPNGDFALKGDEWQAIPFGVEILKKSGLEAVYIDGRPFIA
jgi:hypothetical protein